MKKLLLNKELVAKLNHFQMSDIKGGLACFDYGDEFDAKAKKKKKKKKDPTCDRPDSTKNL